MATTYDKASLVMIPSGVKESKLYSIKPTSGDGDFTFSRGTDTATRVNSSGLIEKERGNLLPYSNTFSNANWTQARVTLTSGQSGYDGSSDAWSVVPTADNNTHAFFYNITGALVPSGVHTFSVYAKANGYSYIVLRDSATTEGKAKFDLSTGVTESTGAIASKITSVGGGWYRCEVTTNRTSGGGNNFLIYTQESYTYDVGYVGNTTSGVLIQDAQINQGLVAQPYIETTTAAVYEGITDNLPRLDYSGGASCPSLLLEPSRTNLINNSEYFGAWTGSAVYSANADISPSGYQDAATLNDNTTGYLDIRKSPAITANTTHTYSLFVKKTTGSLTHYAGIGILLTGGSAVVDYGIINTTTGAINRDASSNVNSVSYSSESYGNYWRVIMTFTDNQSNTLCTCIVYPAISTNGTSISQTAQGSNVFWGAQLEAGSYPTSYIPTYGTSASRAVDVAYNNSASSLINSEEGVVFVDITLNGLTDYGTPLSLTDGTLNNYVWLTIFANGNLRAELYNGAAQASISYSGATAGNRYKMAFAYAENDFVLYVNGTQVGTDNSGSTFSANTLTRIDTYLTLGIYSKSAYKHNQALVFKTRLTNAELAALTTI